MACFGLKLGQDLGNRAAHPYRKFRGVPPREPIVFRQQLNLTYVSLANGGNSLLKILLFTPLQTEVHFLLERKPGVQHLCVSLDGHKGCDISQTEKDLLLLKNVL